MGQLIGYQPPSLWYSYLLFLLLFLLMPLLIPNSWMRHSVVVVVVVITPFWNGK